MTAGCRARVPGQAGGERERAGGARLHRCSGAPEPAQAHLAQREPPLRGDRCKEERHQESHNHAPEQPLLRRVQRKPPHCNEVRLQQGCTRVCSLRQQS